MIGYDEAGWIADEINTMPDLELKTAESKLQVNLLGVKTISRDSYSAKVMCNLVNRVLDNCVLPASIQDELLQILQEEIEDVR